MGMFGLCIPVTAWMPWGREASVREDAGLQVSASEPDGSISVFSVVGISPQLILGCRWYALLLAKLEEVLSMLLVGGWLRWPCDL
jgi:hypothetical protein